MKKTQKLIKKKKKKKNDCQHRAAVTVQKINRGAGVRQGFYLYLTVFSLSNETKLQELEAMPGKKIGRKIINSTI